MSVVLFLSQINVDGGVMFTIVNICHERRIMLLTIRSLCCDSKITAVIIQDADFAFINLFKTSGHLQG